MLATVFYFNLDKIHGINKLLRSIEHEIENTTESNFDEAFRST